jgi:hypothetical protein
MRSSQERTLLRIARCTIFKRGPVQDSPCHKILAIQEDLRPDLRQVPEPWRGEVESPLLFVSSNPSIDSTDDSPTYGSSDDLLVTYFHEGFPDCFPRVRQQNGTPRSYPVRFWSSIRMRAAQIWGLPKDETRPGKDFAITEIVHCKSTKQIGVSKAMKPCMDLHWANTLASSGAKVVVVLGAVAHHALSLEFQSPVIRRVAALGNRWVIMLPHPNARGVKKSVFELYDEEALTPIRTALAKGRLK